MSEQMKAKSAADAPRADGGLPLERAEHIVDTIAERIGRITSNTGLHLSRWAARAREEVEDIVAEAQSLRRGGPRE